MEYLDYVEAAAKENATFHLQNADALAKESNTLLNILLAGATGSLAYFVTLAEKGAAMWLKAGVISVSTYVFLVAGMLLLKCLHVRPIFPAANEPKNLMQAGFELEAVRRVELKNRQTCIDENRNRNDLVGMWLNRCRGFAAATPFVFAIAALAAC